MKADELYKKIKQIVNQELQNFALDILTPLIAKIIKHNNEILISQLKEELSIVKQPAKTIREKIDKIEAIDMNKIFANVKPISEDIDTIANGSSILDSAELNSVLKNIEKL